jgi:hypothetical protein
MRSDGDILSNDPLVNDEFFSVSVALALAIGLSSFSVYVERYCGSFGSSLCEKAGRVPIVVDGSEGAG